MQSYCRPRGLMDKASDFESEDCRFDPCRGRSILQFLIFPANQNLFTSFYNYEIVAFKCEAIVVRVTWWIRLLSSNQKIAGSTPCRGRSVLGFLF